MKRAAVLVALALGFVGLLACLAMHEQERTSPPDNLAFDNQNLGGELVRQADPLGVSGSELPESQRPTQSISVRNIYDQSFLDEIRVVANLNAEGQARQFSKTLDTLSEITGRDPRAVLYGLHFDDYPLVPNNAAADRYFREHADNADSTAGALEGRILNEIWRFSPHLSETPAFVSVECLVEVCRAMVEFHQGYEDALVGVAFGPVALALEIELYEHGIINVTQGFPDVSRDIRHMYLWRQEGSGPEWEAYLPRIPDGLEEMISDSLSREPTTQTLGSESEVL